MLDLSSALMCVCVWLVVFREGPSMLLGGEAITFVSKVGDSLRMGTWKWPSRHIIKCIKKDIPPLRVDTLWIGGNDLGLPT